MERTSYRYKVGWVSHGSFFKYNFFRRKRSFCNLEPFSRMRTGNIAECINLNSSLIHNELYNPKTKYDVVIFQKIMNKHCQEELRKIKDYGGKVIFDANVNYYEIWGEYDVPGTKPTVLQQQDAIFMTKNADWVTASSSYIASIAGKFNSNVTWIPDNVNLHIYNYSKQHYQNNNLILVWSGVAKKAKHLLLLKDVFKRLKGLKLVLVSDKFPSVIKELKDAIPCLYQKFSEAGYAQKLKDCDIIISPKNLNNGYEMGHSEYKITLGMAMGLPAIASPQISYVEAIAYKNGGIIASTPVEWQRAFVLLANDYNLRAEMGIRAKQAVIERYSTDIVANKYMDVIQQVLYK